MVLVGILNVEQFLRSYHESSNSLTDGYSDYAVYSFCDPGPQLFVWFIQNKTRSPITIHADNTLLDDSVNGFI